MGIADDFDRSMAQVDMTLWDYEMRYGDRDPLEVLREFIEDLKRATS
jgi:hypothetical protein